MKTLRWVVALFALMVALPQVASASVIARVSLSSQRMTVYVDGVARYFWSVSTARIGYRTPIGNFRAQRMETMWHSTIYDNAPMPHAIFFDGGYAVHGTNDVWRLGSPASHGCIRLSPWNASVLFGLVRQHGMGASQIIVSR
jgi:lipoprotein-anchoring transpeptidase ErfK/SrfK